jgi:hypothetical protein
LYCPEHVAVWLFASGRFASLTLILPCEWDERLHRFDESPAVNDIGAQLNHQHELFAARTGIDSLANIAQVLRQGATYQVHPSFASQYSALATSPHIMQVEWPGLDTETDMAERHDAHASGGFDGHFHFLTVPL